MGSLLDNIQKPNFRVPEIFRQVKISSANWPNVFKAWQRKTIDHEGLGRLLICASKLIDIRSWYYSIAICGDTS